MKLTGPIPRIRIEPGREHSRAVACGIFPPERAPIYRTVFQRAVDASQPKITDAIDVWIKAESDLLINGESTVRVPRGILSASRPT